ncbi:hypothetical protein A2215_00435 [Candidatus Berkelbacteria bacterium RIFOXYA2_FULL_43_10]|uniref:Uncharacterized protein n=1 Tax=Candidatus Berkelbacteria bacterium RIFOXYA2_FULL_43_10 TaxID=1797472 RepID=A0A1F5E3V3_9BACT|nr:MAG: hypothetical protein A2215_00435 [Candidatus Berkelbacteria bacterium RIFOXYA2_FULL_43_10]
MEFSRSRFIKTILITGLFFLTFGSGIYIYLAKFSADEASDDLIEDLQERPNLDDPTIIRMPAKYTYDQLASAGEISETIKSATDNEIIGEAHNRISEAAKNAPPLSVKDENGEEQYLDIVFMVADSKGQIVQPESAEESISSAGSVEDNFVFDASVPEEVKVFFIEAYPKIGEVYGPRADADPIKVFFDDSFSRPYYNSYNHEIHLGKSRSQSTVIHETVHAFHHHFCTIGSWEEGMAVKVTQLVMDKLSEDYSNSSSLIESGYREAESSNMPDVDRGDVVNNAWDSIIAYQYGSRIMDQLYYADNNFFKAFNSRLYKHKNYWQNSQLVKIAARSTNAEIEGKKVVDWFSEQNALISFYTSYPHYEKPEMFYVWSITLDSSYYRSSDDTIEFGITANYRLRGSGFTTIITYPDGRIIAREESCRDISKGDFHVNKECKASSADYVEYDGVINIEVVPTDNPENKKIVKFVKSGTSSNDMLIKDESDGSLVKLSKISTGENKLVEIKNGYFRIPNETWVTDMGDFKLEEFKKKSNCSGDLSSCLGTKIYERSFHKPMNTYQGTFLSTQSGNKCSPKANDVEATNHSLRLTAKSAIDCNSVFRINNIPLYRYWGKEVKYEARDLRRGTKYNYGLSFASARSIIKKIQGDFTTTNYPDLILLKVENSGSIADNTFSSKLTFNVPLNAESVKNLKYCEEGMEERCWGTKQILPNKKTVVLKPMKKLYNNNYYYIDGIYEVRDKHNYPVYRVNWQDLSFEAPVNPEGAEKPEFNINKDVFGTSENIILTKNFSSKDISNKLGQFKIIYWDENSGLEREIATTASLQGNKIVVNPNEDLIVDNNYGLVTPYELVDDNNNKVPAQYFGFTIQ